MVSLHSLDSCRGSGQLPPADRDAVLGGYRLLSQIAVGEFCTVHRARSLLSASASARAHADVAVKRLRTAPQPADGRARLLHEGRLGIALRAPNLLRVLEIHNEPELFVVMEYVEGASLRELLARSHEIDTLPFIVPVFVDVLRGLSALHQWRDEAGTPQYLVHQAPSARHMLVGTDGVTRLIDLAGVNGRGLSTNASVGRKFLRGELAPEQLSSHARLDPRCDIFLVGAALQDALTRASAVRDACHGEARVRTQCAPLFAIARRASAERRQDRFWSADEMAFKLEHAAVEAGLFVSREMLATWVRGVHRSRGASGLAPFAAAQPVSCAPEPLPVEPALLPRASWPSARLRPVVAVAFAVALLTSVVTLGARGIQHTPTASAARPELDARPIASDDFPGLKPAQKPVVTPLAAALSRVVLRERAPQGLPPSRSGERGVIPEGASLSSAETIAASIREAVESKSRARAKLNLFARPRMLRAELPLNPY